MKINLNPYFKLLRIRDWRSYFFMAIFGFIISKGFLFPLKEIILFWTMVFLFLGFGFSVNDCFDTKEDKYHKEKENPLLSKKISFRNSFIFSILPGILGLILSTIFGLKIFLFCLGAVLLGFFYSAPPLRFKSRPFFDLISHGLFAGSLIFVLPLLIFRTEMKIFHYLVALSFFYFSMMLELRNHLEDYEIDKKGGLGTTAIFLGYKNSEKLLRYLAFFYPLILLPIFLLISQPYSFFFLIFTLIFLPLFLFSKDYKLIKNYRIMDTYNVLSFLLLSVATILS